MFQNLQRRTVRKTSATNKLGVSESSVMASFAFTLDLRAMKGQSHGPFVYC